MNAVLRKGDVVQLTSLPMTINEIDGNVVECKWFDEDCKLHTGTFDASYLKKITQRLVMRGTSGLGLSK
jgi:uncharacterized protein YodC (DUF2158 family)